MLHTADLHLDRSFDGWGDAANSHRQDLLDTMEEIGDIARREEVQLLLMAGDQFDRHNPDTRTFERFRGWLDRLGSDGIRVAIIPGNHDSYWYVNSIYRAAMPSNVHVFSEPSCDQPYELTINGIAVSLYGIAHDHTQQRDIRAGFRRRFDDGVHIGLLHATVDPPSDFEVLDRYLPLSADDLRDTGLDYIALGHLHRSRVINSGGPGLAAYSGSPEPLSAVEVGPRSVLLITFDGDVPSIQRINCGMRRAEREIIECSNMSQEAIARRIFGMADENVIMTAVLRGAPAELVDLEALSHRLSMSFFHLVVSDQTSVIDTQMVQDIELEQTIRGRFVRRMRKLISNAESDRERDEAELALRLGLTQLEKRSASR